MASEEQETQEVQEQQPTGRRSRSDKGLPRRRSLLLSRGASARFVRVAARLPGGEEELGRVLEPIIEDLFNGKYVSAGTGEAALEDIALAYQRELMKGEASDG